MKSSLLKKIHLAEDVYLNNVALNYKTLKWTYKEVATASNKVANYFLSLGIKNPRIGLYLDRSPEAVIAILGIIKAGGVYLPLHRRFPIKRLLYIVKDASLDFIIGDEESEVEGFFKEKHIKFTDCINHTFTTPIFLEASECDPAYIIYTSGSTGHPKGMLIPHVGITKHVEAFCFQLGLSQKDTVGMFAALTFDASISEIFTAYLTGATLTIIPDDIINNFRKFEKYLNEKNITFLTLPPSYQSYLNPGNVRSLRVLISAGSPTNFSLIQQWAKQVVYVNAYGPSEGAICATLYVCSAEDKIYKRIPIGKPLKHITCYLKLENGDVKNIDQLPGNSIGELIISAQCLALEYLNKKNLTSEKFFVNSKGKRCYSTGDIMQLNSAGLLEFIGRTDKQLKIRGIRIEPEEILHSLHTYKNIMESYILCYEDRENQEHLLLFIVGKNKNIDKGKVLRFLSKKIPQYYLPDDIIVVPNFPLTLHGKIDERELIKIYEEINRYVDHYFSSTSLLSKQNPKLEEFAQFFWKILGKKCEVQDNFYTLGIDSITAFKIISAIYQQYNNDITIRDFYSANSIEVLCQMLDVTKERENINKNSAVCSKEIMVNSTEKNLAIANNLNIDSLWYNQVLVLKLFNFLSEQHLIVLNAAVNTLINRHQSFRSKYTIKEGGIYKKVLSKAVYEVILYDEVENNESLEKKIYKHLKHFDLSVPPLLNAFIIKSNDDHYFILDFPHVIIDWLSVHTVIDELNLILNKKLLSKTEDSFENFEQNQQTNEPPVNNNTHVLTLPAMDYLEPFSAAGDSEFLFLGNVSKYQEFCKKNNISLHTFFVLCHTLLLWKLTKSTNISFYIPVMGRNTKLAVGTIGCFVRTSIFELNVIDSLNVHSLLEEIKNKLLEIVNDNTHSTNQIENGTLLNFHLPELNTISFDALYSERVFIKKHNTICDIVFEIEQHQNEFLIYSTFSKNKYQPNTIKNILEIVQKICNQILILDPKKDSIGKIDILSNATIQAINVLNATEQAFDTNNLLLERFNSSLDKHQEQLCIIHGEKSYTYRELEDFSNKISFFLRNTGIIQKNTPIAIFSERSFELIAWLLGILKSGGAFVPFSIDWPIERLISTIQENNIQYLITQKKFEDYFYELSASVNIIYQDNINLDLYPKTPLPTINSSQDIAYIIFTSGTTGKPKGVTESHRAVNNLLEWVVREFNLTNKDNCLWVCSISFDLSIFDIFAMLSVGGKITITSDAERKNIQALVKILLKNNITIWNSAPPILTALVKYLEILNVQDLSLRLILLSGDWIPTDLPKRIWKICCKAIIYSLGGATEATVWSNYYPITKDHSNYPSIPYGKPIQNSKYYVFDEDMSLCPLMVPGELYITGECLGNGYYNQPLLTAESFPTININGDKIRAYKTGDIAFIHSDGDIRLLGRVDHQIKIRGNRVELNEIKACLHKICNIIESEIILYNQHSQTILIAFLVYNEINKNTEYFKQKLRKYLPDYMVPEHLIIIQQMPITSNGKIDRDALYEIFEHTAKAVTPKKEVNTSSHIHKKIYKIFKNTLNNGDITLDQSFLDLGGNSLNAFEIFVELSKDFDLELQDLYDYPSINRLAKILKPKIAIKVYGN